MVQQPKVDLGSLFGAALQAVMENREQLNSLDGYNGNHGDNMVENIRLITEALRSRSSQPPAKALAYASKKLKAEGRGGTSQYYARGLSQAAKQFKGRDSLGGADVMTLVQSLLGAIPSSAEQPKPTAGGSVLDEVMGLASAQAPQEAPEEGGVDLGDMLNLLLPAGLAFLQAKQSGADTGAAAQQALLAALVGGRVNPLQASSPRTAAGGLIARSLLQALMGQA